jgi:lysophospholipase L1-like esterase
MNAAMTLLLPRLAFAFAALLAPTGLGATPPEPLTVVALGTSLTESVDWPSPLAEKLAACWGRTVKVERVAGSGMTSAWGLLQVGRVTALKPDIVLIEFAMNDANWRRFVSRRASRANTLRILREIRQQRPQARMFLMTTNVVHGLRGMMRPRVGTYYAQYREIAASEGAGLIDLEPRWAALSGPELRRAVPDGVHPTLEGFERIALPEIVSAITGGRCPA